MKLRKAEEAELTSANVEVVGFAEKAVDASAGLPEGWAAVVDSDGDTYYVRSQPCHLPRRCTPPPELGPASSRCAVEQGDGRDAVGGPSVRPLSRDVRPPARRASWARRPRPDRARARSTVLVLRGWSVSHCRVCDSVPTTLLYFCTCTYNRPLRAVPVWCLRVSVCWSWSCTIPNPRLTGNLSVRYAGTCAVGTVPY